MSAERVIALLGRRDEPTDAVEEYCRLLGSALHEHSFSMEIRRVPWNEHGWPASLNALRLQGESWRDTWVLAQYTNLAWSSRGFPGRFLRVLRVLRKAGARIAVVFHDAEPFSGTRLIDHFRRAVQLGVMRDAVAFSDCAVLTVPPARLSWLQNLQPTVSFIPVGANLPQPLLEQDHDKLHDPPTIAVYSITGGPPGDRETDEIIRVVRHAAARVGKLRLLVFGRHAEVRESLLQTGLQGCDVEVRVEGVIDADTLVERFAASDVLLFLRGTISSRRGSAIAGIACGLPVIGLRGPETDAPITDAGVVLLEDNANDEDLSQQFAEALAKILSDDTYRHGLAARSRSAQEDFFSWPAIARRYATMLQKNWQV
ncbi:MAG TPA: glycosyltransferase [Candidatus Acidoferrum sp.]|nr:glycosyltransferase [Candidatus Acidoferrum sp.]